MGKGTRSEALRGMIERCAENKELIEVHAEDQRVGKFYCGGLTRQVGRYQSPGPSAALIVFQEG